MADINIDELRQIETGEEEASATSLYVLARALEVAIGVFFENVEKLDANDGESKPVSAQRTTRFQLGHEIGARMRLARKVNGLTQSEVARLSGISEDRLGRCERGETEPSAGDLHALAGTLRVPLQYFFQNLDLISDASGAHPFTAAWATRNEPRAGDTVAPNLPH